MDAKVKTQQINLRKRFFCALAWGSRHGMCESSKTSAEASSARPNAGRGKGDGRGSAGAGGRGGGARGKASGRGGGAARGGGGGGSGGGTTGRRTSTGRQLRDKDWQATCGASCRARASKLIPTVALSFPRVPRQSTSTRAAMLTADSASECEVVERCGKDRCCLVGAMDGQVGVTAAAAPSSPASSERQRLAPRPLLMVAMTTIPPRMRGEHRSHLQHAVTSVFRQSRMPDAVLVSASKRYTRFDGPIPKLEEVLPPRDGLERITCDEDLGPATKLLCALPKMRELARKWRQSIRKRDGNGEGVDGRGTAWAVLMDDDQKYKPWALRLLEKAIRADATGERVALSFDTYTIRHDGVAIPGGATIASGLLVGAGARVFALRLDALEGIEAYFSCLRRIEPRVLYQDDIWFSMFLHDVKGKVPYRIGTNASTMALKEGFPSVHEPTVSVRSPGALITMHHFHAANQSSLPPASSNHQGRRRGAGGGGGGSSAGGQAASEEWPALTLEDKVKRLDGGPAMLALGKTPEQVLQAYSRHALVKALAEMRSKTLSEPRSCGVRDSATWCVGQWCARADASASAAVGSKAWRLDDVNV